MIGKSGNGEILGDRVVGRGCPQVRMQLKCVWCSNLMKGGKLGSKCKGANQRGVSWPVTKYRS